MDPIPQEFSDRMIEMYRTQGQYNYVVSVIRADGTEEVLKLGFPNRELLSEIHALQLYNGSGIAQLLEADLNRQVFLIERIRPGAELATLPHDDKCTRIAAGVMQRSWVPVTGDIRCLLLKVGRMG
jgi:streptomycin 6-kinase